VAVAAAGAATAASAEGATFFLFNKQQAAPGELITIRSGGTPRNFDPSRRQRPFQPSVHLYLVAEKDAAAIRTRFDPRLIRVGTIVLGRDGRGLLTFRLPKLPAGRYLIASWCPRCMPSIGKPRLFILRPSDDIVPRYRDEIVLQVTDTGSSRNVVLGIGVIATIAVMVGFALWRGLRRRIPHRVRVVDPR
jgi:hypothetical protein